MKPVETKIWRELELFAQAMQRGASVHLGDGNTVSPSGDPTGIHVSASVLRQYPILKIIEPTVLRDWTAEDARKHVGFAYRVAGDLLASGIIGMDLPGMKPWAEDRGGVWTGWAGNQYAPIVVGTDPAKWDWKPCKVEVPVEAPEEGSGNGRAITRLAALRARILRDGALPAIAQNFYADDILQICAMLEQP